jgi:hypothetical protein
VPPGDAEPCDRCGQVHARTSTGGNLRATCSAHRRDGQPCTQFPVGGDLGKTCRMHSGTSRLARRGVRKRSGERYMRDVERSLSALVWQHIRDNPSPPLPPPLTRGQRKRVRKAVQDWRQQRDER